MLGCLPVEAERATAAVFGRMRPQVAADVCVYACVKDASRAWSSGIRVDKRTSNEAGERESQSTESVPAAELMGCGTSGSIPKEHPRFLVVGPRPHPHVKLVLIILNSFPFLALCDLGRCSHTKVEPGSNNVCREDMTGVF
jgi:hypothetical protein